MVFVQGVDKMQQHKAHANKHTHTHSLNTNKICQWKVTGDLLPANGVFGVTSGHSGYCNIHVQTRLNKPDPYLFIYLFLTITEADHWGLTAQFSQSLPVVPAVPASNGLASNAFYAWLQRATDYLSHWFDIKACAGFDCVLCCKTNNSD